MFTHEIIRYDEKLPVKLLLQKIGNVEMHWHESMELLMVLTGRVTVETEGARVELLPEDLILINPHEMHATTGGGRGADRPAGQAVALRGRGG